MNGDQDTQRWESTERWGAGPWESWVTALRRSLVAGEFTHQLLIFCILRAAQTGLEVSLVLEASPG